MRLGKLIMKKKGQLLMAWNGKLGKAKNFQQKIRAKAKKSQSV